MMNRNFMAFLIALCVSLGAARAAEPEADDPWSLLAPHFDPPAELADELGDYRSPLLFEDGTRVTSADEWPRRRKELLNLWHGRMKPWPALIEEPQLLHSGSERRESFTQHHYTIQVGIREQDGVGGSKWNFYSNAYLLVPDGKGPFPAVLVTFYDAETSVGLGKKGHESYDFGLQLARRGFVTLSISTPWIGSDTDRDTVSLLVKAAKAQGRQPLSILGLAAANACTVLASRPEVDKSRIGVVGLSYGSKWAMFASCLDERFACAVWSDPGIVWDESNRNVNYWEPWYLGYERGRERKPGIPTAENPRTGLYKDLVEAKRDLVDLHALMAPRPFLVSGGTEDKLNRWTALNHTRGVYTLLGHKQRIGLTTRDTHEPTPLALKQTLAFFDHFLKKPQ